ncbi:MAG: hypothetical protein M1814_006762 [Vezdaea aestivalis]|nr:MAG: hypothetical protein M1814_006762 [Vezdaea aestivalis]
MSYQKPMTITGWFRFAICLVFTIARLWIQCRKLGRLYWDDATHVASLIVLLGFVMMNEILSPVATQLFDVQTGKAKLTAALLLEDVPTFLQYTFGFGVLNYANLWLVKYTFLVLYQRLFRDLRGLMIAWWTVFVNVTIAYLGTWVTLLINGGSPKGYFELAKLDPLRVQGEPESTP